LMQPGEQVYEQVVARFGAGILSPDGSVNRARLAELAFGGAGQPSRMQELNQIVHPAVIRRQEEWMAQVGRGDAHAIALVEAALILEAGMAGSFDRLIVVTCRPEQRIERWAQRLKVDQETARREVTRRAAAQLPDEEKIKAADYVIDNSRSLDETKRQVEEIYAELKKAAES
jgi:dephospho-CoA kinase